MPVADSGFTSMPNSPRPDAPVMTAITSEPPTPKPAWISTGTKPGEVLTWSNGAGKAAPRGRICVALRATRKVQPKISGLWAKPEPALRSWRSSSKLTYALVKDRSFDEVSTRRPPS